MNARLEIRLLAHSIDAATLSAGRKRKPKQRRSSALIPFLLLLALAAAAFAIPRPAGTANSPPRAEGGAGNLSQQEQAK